MTTTTTTTQVISVSFSAPSAAASEAAIYTQLAADANAELSATEFLSFDTSRWNAISAEIGALVALAQGPGKNADQVSLIYGQIMLIITCEYLPTISDYLGDQIAQQAATENIASDVSGFILDAENGFNSLATTYSTSSAESLLNGTMALIGNSVGGMTGTTYSFSVEYEVLTTITSSDLTVAPTYTSTSFTKTEASILDFLTDNTIWLKTSTTTGSSTTTSGVTPLSTSGASQISTAMADIPTIFNATQQTVTYGVTGSAGSAAPSTSTYTNAWTDSALEALGDITYTWTQVYGSSSLIPTNFGQSNSPLVYTMPNSIQGDLNQASQAVQTVSTTQQTIQNFTVQEIDQYYGITNSIQQSQEAQCAAIVKHYSG